MEKICEQFLNLHFKNVNLINVSSKEGTNFFNARYGSKIDTVSHQISIIPAVHMKKINTISKVTTHDFNVCGKTFWVNEAL